MSINIVLYFRGPTPAELAAELGRLARYSSLRYGETLIEEWSYPDAGPRRTLNMFLEDCGLDDYEDEPELRAAVEAVLGGPPTAGVSVFLRGRTIDGSAREALALARRLLRALSAAGCAVDDNCREIWTLAEIEAGVAKEHGRFLDCHRGPERQRHGSR